MKTGIFIILTTTFCTMFAGAQNTEPATSPWPRAININKENIKGILTVYQPQLESMKGDKITARAAFSFKKEGKSEPVFGAMWLNAKVEIDRTSRTVKLLSVTVPKAVFPGKTDEKLRKLDMLIRKKSADWDFDISLDRLLAMLDLADRTKAAALQLNTTPPEIILRDHPAVLVPIHGTPKLEKIKGTNLMRVINTPALIILDSGNQSYYMQIRKEWVTTTSLTGKWQQAVTVPSAVASYAAKETDYIDIEKNAKGDTMPEVIVATKPAELIVCRGTPQFSPLGNSGLLYINNTDTDAFLDIATQRYYVLIAGRWFTSDNPTEGWAYIASTKLPKNFQEIPEDSVKGHVLASVAGTEQAKDAVLEAQVPQTARVNRSATINVTYDGKPSFQNIKGTNMQYAVNTQFSVLKINDRYYCCKDAVWFEANSAEGPWKVCVKVPPEIDSLPPDNPLYNVKYAQVYDSNDQYAYCGYTPGYNGSYVYDDTVVYGTGYEYNDWYGGVYYCHPMTYGFRAIYNPNTGGWVIGGGGWGWYRKYPPISHYHNYLHRNVVNRYKNWGNRAVVYNRNPYRRPGQIPDTRPGVIPSTRPGATAFKGVRTAVPGTPRATAVKTRQRAANNVFTDQQGNIYRRTTNGWEQQQNGKWARTNQFRKSQQESRYSRPGYQWPSTKSKTSYTTKQNRGYQWPSTKSRTSYNRNRTYTRNASNLEAHYESRNRGDYRSYRNTSSRFEGGGRFRGRR